MDNIKILDTYHYYQSSLRKILLSIYYYQLISIFLLP